MSVAPAWREGALGNSLYGKYKCTDCGIILNSMPRTIDNCKCIYAVCTHKPILQCPVCVSKIKTPTIALDKEELEKRKAEIRDRLK